jgi:hypothetical protein
MLRKSQTRENKQKKYLLKLDYGTVKSLLFVGYQLRIQGTMKLGKPLDIDILANAVLE